jgi:hypothetical protein
MPIKVILLKLPEAGPGETLPHGYFYWVSESLRKFQFKIDNPEWYPGAPSSIPRYELVDNAKALVDKLKQLLSPAQAEAFENASKKKRSGVSV